MIHYNIPVTPLPPLLSLSPTQSLSDIYHGLWGALLCYFIKLLFKAANGVCLGERINKKVHKHKLSL